MLLVYIVTEYVSLVTKLYHMAKQSTQYYVHGTVNIISNIRYVALRNVALMHIYRFEQGLSYKKDMVEYFYSVTDEKQSLNAGAHENKNYCFEHKPLYKKEMAEFDFYTPTAEKQEMIDQYLARTDAEYRARNRANIDSSVKRFNAELVEKYGAENLNPEDFLVIPKEGYHDGLFEKYFRACIDRVEKKFQNKQIHINQESAFLPVVMNDALREMLAHPDYSECIASFIASINKHSSDTKGESKPNTTDHFNGDTNNSCSLSPSESCPMRCAVESRGYLQESHLKELVHCNAEHFPQTMFAHKDPSGSLRGQSPELISYRLTTTPLFLLTLTMMILGSRTLGRV
ncbi:hypothetical protein GLOIN_2v1784414 [Rhizophagus irregularis DAOM 181602=DAOM 197198]|nr:hypothetical protein GLOIN_2v1784414 [Rhizophagus irregularis DAOM 181602=DAOM 197198]